MGAGPWSCPAYIAGKGGGKEPIQTTGKKRCLITLTLFYALNPSQRIFRRQQLHNDDRKAFGCSFEASLEPTEAVNPTTTSQPTGTEHFFMVQQVLWWSKRCSWFCLGFYVVFSKHGFLCRPADSSVRLGRWGSNPGRLQTCTSSHLVSGELPFLEIMSDLWKLKSISQVFATGKNETKSSMLIIAVLEIYRSFANCTTHGLLLTQ